MSRNLHPGGFPIGAQLRLRGCEGFTELGGGPLKCFLLIVNEFVDDEMITFVDWMENNWDGICIRKMTGVHFLCKVAS